VRRAMRQRAYTVSAPVPVWVGAGSKTQAPGRSLGREGILRALLLCLTTPLGSGCDSSVVDPPKDGFGHMGEVVLSISTPLHFGTGNLLQELTWGTSGAWTLYEEISYRGLVGGTTTRESVGDPSLLAAAYAELIVRLGGTVGISLFVDGLPPGVTAECGLSRSSITITIRDDVRGESISWQQCVDDSLSYLSELGAGPLPTAARLASAGIQIRNATVGRVHLSPYYGSLPFGTIRRGEAMGSFIKGSMAIDRQLPWQAFWTKHVVDTPAPFVDFQRDHVVVALVGERYDAGVGVEVRSVFTTKLGTVTNIVEKVPGDFCSPGAKTTNPFHIVVTPRTLGPHEFNALPKEYVPCGY